MTAYLSSVERRCIPSSVMCKQIKPRTTLNIDTTFNFYSDSNGKDPDWASPTLRKYHRILWSKELPNGESLDLSEKVKGSYLYARINELELYIGSDAITHSYKNHSRKQHIVSQIPKEVDELFLKGSSIGGYIVFPNNSIDKKHTINQARGIKRIIDDRFDLTLECIRRFYLGLNSPLYDTIKRYEFFFKLFIDFQGYTSFFLLNDIVDKNGKVKFYLPFNDFRMNPDFKDIEEYREYKSKVVNFIYQRNTRIKKLKLDVL